MDTYELARARAQNIRNTVDDPEVDTSDIIGVAYKARDWEAQGYEDWETYVEAEFDLTALHPTKVESVRDVLLKHISNKLFVLTALGVELQGTTPQKELKRMARRKLGKYQVARPLTNDEMKALEASIKENGILEPIVVDEDGNIIDGHHRQKIGDKLEIEVPQRVLRGLDEDQKLEAAKELNFNRRHLNSEEKRQLIADELQANPKESNRKIARLVGASEGTVRNIRKELEATAQITQTDTSVGADGVERKKPAPKPKPEPEEMNVGAITEQLPEDEEHEDDTTAYNSDTAPLSALHALSQAVVQLDKAADFLGADESEKYSLADARAAVVAIIDGIEKANTPG